MTALPVFIGFDSSEPEAYQVAAYTLRKHSTVPLAIHALKQDRLRQLGLYTRAHDALSSTEFSLTRFLVPRLCAYRGFGVFFDCDFMWRRDIGELIHLIDPGNAVSVVKHDYVPRHETKMDGRKQIPYARKNWSSLMVFNASHPSCVRLTPEYVNSATAGALHRLEWAGYAIGNLPRAWNWLEGEYERTAETDPAAVHFTNGGPWHNMARSLDYGDEWLHELNCALKEMGS